MMFSLFCLSDKTQLPVCQNETDLYLPENNFFSEGFCLLENAHNAAARWCISALLRNIENFPSPSKERIISGRPGGRPLQFVQAVMPADASRRGRRPRRPSQAVQGVSRSSQPLRRFASAPLAQSSRATEKRRRDCRIPSARLYCLKNTLYRIALPGLFSYSRIS